MLLWIENMDIGLGNGLRNKIAEYTAHGDDKGTRIVISSAFALLTCIIIPMLLILLLLIFLNFFIISRVPSYCLTNLFTS